MPSKALHVPLLERRFFFQGSQWCATVPARLRLLVFVQHVRCLDISGGPPDIDHSCTCLTLSCVPAAACGVTCALLLLQSFCGGRKKGPIRY